METNIRNTSNVYMLKYTTESADRKNARANTFDWLESKIKSV